MKALSEPRAATRRMRRTRKTHQRRLSRLNQALVGIGNGDLIVRFCRRRGFSYDSEDDAETGFRIPREVFFESLRHEIERVILPGDRRRVLSICQGHLNEARTPGRELRPARFENRGRARCQWEGCRHNVPRARRAVRGRLQQALFLWLRPVFDVCDDRGRLRKSIEHWIGELEWLASGYARIRDSARTADEQKAERAPLDRRLRRVYANLLRRVDAEAPDEIAEQFRVNWSETYRDNVSRVVRGKSTGRCRYCREHSATFVEYVLEGKPIPNRGDLAERDLVARTQQIVFARLWRLVEGRLLPLAGGWIDRIIVERVAFDVLSGPIKARQEMSEARASEIYWWGPQAGFSSRLEMLREEFGGRCAYCGAVTATDEVEHVLQRSRFPFDSYFNLVPACRDCNSRKGSRSALEAGMTIHADAYAAYGDYLRRKKVLHPYHTIKKGLLNLLQRPATAGRAEQMIAIVADNLVRIAQTQRSARPLARYLATKLADRTRRRPEIAYRAGRHTALYRSVILPEYDKQQERLRGDVRNHAIDAIVLGCDLPLASALENRDWTRTAEDVARWMESVGAAAPEVIGGVPKVEPVGFVRFFEEDAGDGYCTIALHAFNWNQRRRSGYKLDPFRLTRRGVPLKRVAAAEVLANLLLPANRERQIAEVCHRVLRERLAREPERAAVEFVNWLQQTTSAGLRDESRGRHPSDRERYRLLEEFVRTPVERFVEAEQPGSIPQTIGVACLHAGSQGNVNVVRALPGNVAAQFYQADPVWRCIIVGYKLRNGELDREKPILFTVSHTDAVFRRRQSRWAALDDGANAVLRGRALGSNGSVCEFRERWSAAFKSLCASEGIVRTFTVRQGCVIEKIDGSLFQMRNFDGSQPWMKNGPFKNIRRVHRSPFRVMQ